MSAAGRSALAPVAPMVAKLVRLLGSDRDGEVIASVHALRRVLANAGLTLHDLAGAIELPVSSREESDPDWRVMARACAQHPYVLSEREREFIATMLEWRSTPSRRQADWLAAIHARVQEEAA